MTINKMFTKKFLIFIIIFTIIVLIYPNFSQAVKPAKDQFNSGLKSTGEGAGYDPAKPKNIEIIAGLVIKGILALLGIIFTCLIIYGGYLWMTAHGEEQRVTKAQATIRSAIIGLIIVLAAYAITAFVGQLAPTTPSATTPATPS